MDSIAVARLQRGWRISGAAAAASGVAGIFLLTSIPAELLKRMAPVVVAIAISIAIVTGVGLILLFAPRATRVPKVVAMIGLAAMPVGTAALLGSFNRKMCFEAYQGLANPVLEADTEACVDALQMIVPIAMVMSVLSLIALLAAVLSAAMASLLRQAQAGKPALVLGSELEKLARLRGDGAITDDEFSSAKRRLLGAG